MARRDAYWFNKFGGGWSGPKSAPVIKVTDEPWIRISGTPKEIADRILELEYNDKGEPLLDVTLEIMAEEGYTYVNVVRSYWVPATADDIARAEAELTNAEEDRISWDRRTLELIKKRSPELFRDC